MSKITDTQDILADARHCIECVFMAATALSHEEIDPIQAVANIASGKIDEAIALLREYSKYGDLPVPDAPAAEPVSPAPQTKRKGIMTTEGKFQEEKMNNKIGDAEDIFVEARSYIECVRLAACQLPTCEESEAIAAVAMAAYKKIEEGRALLDECPPPPQPDYGPRSRPARTKKSGK